jgi:hypothetical protein
MHRSPTLVLVDPRAAERAQRRQRLLSLAVGTAIALAAATPFASGLLQ